jgi:hypothetical protein
LIWSTARSPAAHWAIDAVFGGLAAEGHVCEGIRGRVASIEARGKPTVWYLEADGTRRRVATWHKDGVRLRIGDTVEVRGVVSPREPSELHQFDSVRDNIAYLERMKNACDQ